MQEGDLFSIQDKGLGYDALLSRHVGVAEYKWNLPGTREVFSRDPKEVKDEGLQGHDHTYGIKTEAISSSETVYATMYHHMVCSLMYLMNTRLDTCFAMNTLRHVHLLVAKHVVRYLKGTVDYGLKYEANQNINLEGYVDSDWASSAIDRKRTLG